MTSPTSRTLTELRKRGWTCATVEKWIPATPAGFKGHIIRKDVFGFGDILAMRVGVPGATLVQVTGGSANFQHRLQKIRGIAEAGIWIASGNRILLHCWRKVGARGERKKWECREMEITAETLKAPEQSE